MSSWPLAVYTPLVAQDNVATTLANAMAPSDNVAVVISGTGWQANMVAYICDGTNPTTQKCSGTFESMLVLSVFGNVLTVQRGYEGTTAIAHSKGRPISNAPVAAYNTSLTTEVLALERQQGTGSVVMKHDATGAWSCYKPDGTTLSTSGTTTQGLQECINYSQIHAVPLVVYGGGITPPSTGIPPSTALSQIVCTSTLAFPTGWNNSYTFYNVNLVLNTGSSDGITFDSADLTTVNFEDSQIIYTGTASAVHFNPMHDNGEGFAGFTTNTFKLGHVICAVVSTLLPDPTKGTAIRISSPALGLGLPNGNGIFVNNSISATEVNSGLTGLLIDNPGGSGSNVEGNVFEIVVIHGQGATSISEGTSATSSGRIFGNTYCIGEVNSSTTGISLWGGTAVNAGGNVYNLGMAVGTTASIVFNSSADGALVYVGYIASSGNDYVNNATAQTNFVIDSIKPALSSFSATGSPFVYQNKDLKPETIISSGGTVSAIEFCMDGASYIGIATSSLQGFFLPVGGFLRWTYTGAPNIFKVK